MTTPICFVDCETTGLYPWAGAEPWEVALITQAGPEDDPGPDGLHGPEWVEYVWHLPVNLGTADPIALTIGRFHERYVGSAWESSSVITIAPGHVQGVRTDLSEWALDFARLTHGKHLVGAVPSFDAAFLSRLLRANGACPGWNYHLIDVEALAIGYLRGLRHAHGQAVRALGAPHDDLDFDLSGTDAFAASYNFTDVDLQPPWNSTDLTRAVGVDPDQFEKHTALGDARWARAIYDKIMGGPNG